MKKILSFLLLTAAILFVSPNKSLAQCVDNGGTFYCNSYSDNGSIKTENATWATDATVFWVTVSLRANHPTEGYAYAEVTTPNGYWVYMITQQDTYQDDFSLPGTTGGYLMLYASSRYGWADVAASW
jgi:hypothetical protein